MRIFFERNWKNESLYFKRWDGRNGWFGRYKKVGFEHFVFHLPTKNRIFAIEKYFKK
jgi:hypothetical protein